MKTRLVLLAIILAFSIPTQAQLFSENKLSRAEKKALKKEIKVKRSEEVNAMLRDTAFIVEGDRVSTDGVHYTSVNPNACFIAILQDKILVQTGLPDTEYVRHFGNRTMQADLRDLRIEKTRNGKATRIKALFTADIGNFRVDMHILNQGIVNARIEVLNSSYSIQLRGDLNSFENSKVYTGGPVY